MTQNLRRIILSVALLLGAQASHAVVNVEVGLGGTRQKPEGTMGYKGIDLDVASELGYGQITAFTGRVKLDIPIVPSIYLQAHPMKFEGTGTKNVNFQFGDRVFNANVPFQSSLRLDHYDLTLFYSLPFLKLATNEILNVELGLNARYVNFEGNINQTTSGISETKKQELVVPMGYLGLQVSPVDMLSLEGELKGIAYGSNQYVDALARLKVKVFKIIFVGGGYKHQSIILDRDSARANLRIGGPFVEAGIDF